MIKIIKEPKIICAGDLDFSLAREIRRKIGSSKTIVFLLDSCKIVSSLESNKTRMLRNVLKYTPTEMIQGNFEYLFHYDSWIAKYFNHDSSVDKTDTTLVLPDTIQGIVATYTLVFYSKEQDDYILVLNTNPFMPKDPTKNLSDYLTVVGWSHEVTRLGIDIQDYKFVDMYAAFIVPDVEESDYNCIPPITTSKVILLSDLYKIIAPYLPKIDKETFSSILESLSSSDKHSKVHALRTLSFYNISDYKEEFRTPFIIELLSKEIESIFHTMRIFMNFHM